MSKRKFLYTLAVITLMIAGTNHLMAQAPPTRSGPGSFKGESTANGLSMGPSARPFDATESAFIDTDYYSYDAQLWAPWDITSPDGSQMFQNGFYAELGYAYYSIGRPDAVPGADPRQFNTGNDYHWAGDVELGWYSTKDHGWAANWFELEGITYVNGSNIVITNPMLLRTTINDFQVNRQFRQRLSNGGWIEPYFGARYYNLNDQSTEDGSLSPVLGYRFGQKVNNSAFGGHVGTRYFRQYDRFKCGWDISLGAMYNDQQYFASSYVINTVTTAVTNNEGTNADNDVVPVLDLGVEIDFALSRDISLRGGLGLQYIWQGIARADSRTATINPNFTPSGLVFPSSVNSEDLVAAGFSFGIDWKR